MGFKTSTPFQSMDFTAGGGSKPKLSARPGRRAATSMNDVHRCHTLSDLQHYLAERCEHAKNAFILEQLAIGFQFFSDAVMRVRNMSDEVRQSFGIPPPKPQADGGLIQLSVPTVVTPIPDQNMKRLQQRVVLEEILRIIKSVDGFHWVITSTQERKSGDGYRFSYACCDSYQNKDRAINRKRKLEAAEDIKLGGSLVIFKLLADIFQRRQHDSHI
jgi:hypothetical protein